MRIEPREKDNILYTQIPIGALVAELFSEAKIDNINEKLEVVESQAKEVEKIYQEMALLVDSCSCSNCQAGECQEGSPSHPDCSSECWCSGSPGKNGDPCGPVKVKIEKKALELGKARLLLEEAQIELREKIESSDGFKKVYNDLLLAEEIIKGCNFIASSKGNPQQLMGYNEFWQYVRDLEGQKEIKDTTPQYPFEYVDDSLYWPSTFYCTEIYYSIDIEEITSGFAEDISTEAPAEGRESIYCGAEIKIGETIDQVEEIASDILEETEEIEKNIQKIAESAKNLIALPSKITCDSCSPSMATTFDGCSGYSCGECCPIPKGVEDFLIIGIKVDQYGCHYGCCDLICEDPYCDSCSCSCSGSPFPSGSAVSETEVTNRLDDIDKSADEIRVLMDEKGKLIQKITSTQEGLRYCISSESLGKELQTCSYMKDQLQGYFIFFNELGEQITDCYSRTFDDETIFDNYYCCQYKTIE
jgi:predicted transcriptional regulator